jgi:hypothetical protein
VYRDHASVDVADAEVHLTVNCLQGSNFGTLMMGDYLFQAGIF